MCYLRLDTIDNTKEFSSPKRLIPLFLIVDTKALRGCPNLFGPVHVVLNKFGHLDVGTLPNLILTLPLKHSYFSDRKILTAPHSPTHIVTIMAMLGSAYFILSL